MDHNKIILYTSVTLSKLWGKGFVTIGDLTFKSAAYVARYITKKITGPDADDYYKGRKPEYNTMSRRPGIGHAWYEKYKDEVYPEDLLIIQGGIKTKPPKYYDKLYTLTNPQESENIKIKRATKAKENPHNSPKRLYTRWEIQKQKYALLKRGI